MTHSTRSARLALPAMVLAMLIFGSVGILAPHTGLKAFELVFVRCVGGSLFLGAGWLLSGQFKLEVWNRRELLRIAFCGLALVANWVCLFRAFEMMPVTAAVALYYLAPVFVLLAGMLFFGEATQATSVLAIALCFAGSALVAGIDGESLTALLSSGPLWAVLAALFYATLTILGKGVRQLSPYAVACLQTLLGVLLLPLFVNFNAFQALGNKQWLALLVLGGVHTGLVYFLFFGSIRHLPTRLISVLAYLDPISAMALDILINGFRPNSWQVAGIVLMAGGLALSSMTDNKAAVNCKESVT